MWKRFVVASFASFEGAAIFAIFFNAWHGSYLIGSSHDGMLLECLGLGICIAAALAVTGSLSASGRYLRAVAAGGLMAVLVCIAAHGDFLLLESARYLLQGGFAAAFAALLNWAVFAELKSGQ